MTRRMTTTSWTNWQPKQPTYVPEQSLPERARLSICDRSIDAVAIVCNPTGLLPPSRCARRWGGCRRRCWACGCRSMTPMCTTNRCAIPGPACAHLTNAEKSSSKVALTAVTLTCGAFAFLRSAIHYDHVEASEVHSRVSHGENCA